MKDLHIMNDSIFIYDFIEFIKENFDINKHKFIIIGNSNKITKEMSNIEGENIIEIKKLNWKNPKGIFEFEKNIYGGSYDKIHLHSLFNWNLVRLLFLQPWLVKKSNWIIWGRDLYMYEEYKEDFIECLRRSIIKKLNEITSYIPGDYKLAKEVYDTSASYNHAIPYTVSAKHNLFKELKAKSSNVDNIIFQIGNSADPSNNHLEVLDILSKFKNKNIKIIVPLSYGNPEHRKKVIKYGRKIFDNKFEPLTDFYSPKRYFKILSKVDVGIFNHERQQGLGNINALLQLEKKVYIRSDVTSWDYFKKIGVKLYDTKKLKNESFNEIISYDKSKAEKNSEIMEKTRTKERRVKLWEKIFEND